MLQNDKNYVIQGGEMTDLKFKSESRAGKLAYRIGLITQAILSIPKTIYFNFRCFPFLTAVKLPVLISYNTQILELHKGIIVFDQEPYRFMVKFGFGGSSGIIDRKSLICLERGHVHFYGKTDFCAGISLRNSGEIVFGNRFWANKNCTIWCSNSISFGDDVLLGWNIVFRDSDGHLIISNNVSQCIEGPISIGKHCWICSETHILKNSGIGNDCVLGYGSLLTRKYEKDNTLFVGRPAKPIKEGINWERGE